MSLSSLFQRIETEIAPLDGWCTKERACEMAAMIIAIRPKLSVCLGVWGGRDTFAMAMAHQYLGVGMVMAVDPWQAAASVEGQQGEDKKWWSDQETHNLVYSRFVENLDRLQLVNEVMVYRTTSDAAPLLEGIGLLSIDGNHGPQAIKDVEKFAPNVIPGGFVYMDDIQWAGGAVIEAVKALKKKGFIELFQRDNGAFFQRTE